MRHKKPLEKITQAIRDDAEDEGECDGNVEKRDHEKPGWNFIMHVCGLEKRPRAKERQHAESTHSEKVGNVIKRQNGNRSEADEQQCAVLSEVGFTQMSDDPKKPSGAHAKKNVRADLRAR